MRASFPTRHMGIVGPKPAVVILAGKNRGRRCPYPALQNQLAGEVSNWRVCSPGTDVLVYCGHPSTSCTGQRAKLVAGVFRRRIVCRCFLRSSFGWLALGG